MSTQHASRWVRRALLAACLLVQAASAHAAREVLEFEIGGERRSVLLHVPDTQGAEARPLVVIFHGYGDDSAPFAEAVRLHEDWPAAIVAYPRGEPRRSPSKRGWLTRAGGPTNVDLQLVDQLLRTLAERFGTRPENTHAAGFSNGGHFVFLLLSERADAFATFTIIGAVQPDFASDAPPKPVMYLFGRGEGQRYRDDWAKTVEALTRHNRTSGPVAPFEDCCHLQSAGPGGAPLVFGLYNAGHIWPYDGNAWLAAFAGHDW